MYAEIMKSQNDIGGCTLLSYHGYTVGTKNTLLYRAQGSVKTRNISSRLAVNPLAQYAVRTATISYTMHCMRQVFCNEKGMVEGAPHAVLHVSHYVFHYLSRVVVHWM